MRRILSIAALLLIATASMANAPKPEPKPEPQEGGEPNCIPYFIACDRGYSYGKICAHASTLELVQMVDDMAETFCHGKQKEE